MNSLLHPEIGPDNEFVLTPEANYYIVVLKVTPEQAAVFNSKTSRLGICIRVEILGSDDSLLNQLIASFN